VDCVRFMYFCKLGRDLINYVPLLHMCSYRKVIVVIGVNPSKRYDVTPEERADLTRRMLKRSATSSNVEVHVVKGYIWRHAKREGAEIFFRGIRSWEKDGREERSLQILNTWGPLLLGPLWYPIPTQFLEGKPEYNHISSTLIRDLSSIPNSSVTDLEHLVPKSIVKDVTKLYGW
jgi:phosphopantetheine adenylyltransferase